MVVGFAEWMGTVESFADMAVKLVGSEGMVCLYLEASASGLYFLLAQNSKVYRRRFEEGWELDSEKVP